MICISYGLLRASHSRNPTGDRLRRSVAAFAPPLHTLCERMWLTARAYSHFRAACASLRAHTCCLRNRIQSLTHAFRVTSLFAFSKSLYIKKEAVSGVRRSGQDLKWLFQCHDICLTGSPERYQSTGEKSSLPAPQIGHTQSSGRSSNAVPGAIPLSGSPSAGSYTYPQGPHSYFCIAITIPSVI